MLKAGNSTIDLGCEGLTTHSLELLAMIMKGKVYLTDRVSNELPGFSKTDCDFYFCTWNLRTLYRPASLQFFCQQLVQYKADITAEQELRLLHQGVIKNLEFTKYYSCHVKHNIFGTGFIVGKRIKHLEIDFKPISEHICKIILKGRFHNYTIIIVHAPTEEAELEEKERSYYEVETMYTNFPKGIKYFYFFRTRFFLIFDILF